jgi:histidine ammonia-lyase
VDSIPTSLGQEDHVSMGSISAFKLLSVLRNVERVLAVELLTSAQALDFRSSFLPGHGVSISHKALRKEITHAVKDYEVGNDLHQCAEILRSGALLKAVENELGPLG